MDHLIQIIINFIKYLYLKYYHFNFLLKHNFYFFQKSFIFKNSNFNL